MLRTLLDRRAPVRAGRPTFALAAALLACVAGLPVHAASTHSVRDDDFRTLQEGEFESVALSSDGFLTPSYARSELGDTGAEIVWKTLELPGGRVVAATGHSGKLIRFGADGKPETVADVEDPEITAVAAMKDGSIVFGTAPSGRIHRLDANDKLTTVTTVAGRFIWDLEVDDSGVVWAATGGEGKLYKIAPAEAGVKVDLAADFPSRNLVDVWIDRDGLMGPKGHVFVGGQDPGWLYRFDPLSGKGGPVHNADVDEVRALCPSPEGLILGVNTDRAPTPQALTMTLRLSGAEPVVPQGEEGGGAPSGPGGGPGKALEEIFGRPRKPPKGPLSEVVLLTPEGFARKRWSGLERPIHSIAPAPGGGLIVAAGGAGRIYELHPDDTFSLIADLKEDFVVHVARAEGGWILGAARNGVVFRMEEKRAAKATYRSRVIDAGVPSTWGRFHLGGGAGDGSLKVAFRSGASDDPERGGWGEWSEEAAVERVEGAAIPPGPSRYLQYRLSLESPPAGASPRLDWFEVFHRAPNRAPRVTKVIASTAPPPRPAPPSGSRPQGDEEETPAPPPPPPGGQSSATTPDSNGKVLTLQWMAEDPDGDELEYAVHYKASDETNWRLLDDEIRVTRLPLGVALAGDGRYRFRVTASDRLKNLPGQGLEGILASDEVVIDNTAPRIEGLQAVPEGKGVRVSFTVADELSLVSGVAFKLDGGDEFPLLPKDGIADQRREEFEWTSGDLAPGEHVFAVHVTDRPGNTIARRLVFQVAE